MFRCSAACLRLKDKNSHVLSCQVPVFPQVLTSAGLFIGFTTSKQHSIRDCWTPDISFDAAFLQPSKDQQERQRRAASQQQSPLITVRAISKNPDEGYKGLSLQKRFHYSFLSLPFLCWQRKGTKEEPYWLKTSRTVKQQDTTDRSCMAGIRIKVERAWRRKHTTKGTGDWQTFFFFFCGEKRMEWKVWSYEKIERERLPNRGGPFLASVRLHSRSF